MTFPVHLHTHGLEATYREPSALSQHVGSKFLGHGHGFLMHFGPLSVSMHTGLVAGHFTVAQDGPHLPFARAGTPPSQRQKPAQADANAQDFQARASVLFQSTKATRRGNTQTEDVHGLTATHA
jgi:hypothetical protein